VPVSVGFGRRLRYLVWDQHHERLAGHFQLDLLEGFGGGDVRFWE